MSTLDMLTYNSIDSGVTLDVRDGFFDEIDRLGHRPIYDQTIQLLQPLMYFMSKGLRVDHDQLKLESARLEKEINEKQEELNRLCGREFNAHSPKQCQQYFYLELGIPPYTKVAKNSNGTKSSRITCDDKALARIARGTSTRPPVRQAKLVQEIRGLVKLKGTYVDMVFDEDGRFRCSFNPRGTRFARVSSSKTVFGTGMNMQNLPDSFKRFIIADDGKIRFEMDKRQAEWVAVAFIAGEANMMKVCQDGKDPHTHTASEMYKMDEASIKAEHKIIGHSTDPDDIAELRKQMDFLQDHIQAGKKLPRNMSMRQAGKKSNHGLNYREGYRMFALHNEMQESDAKVICDLYHRIYPGLSVWYQSIENKLRKDRTLVNCFGRSYKFLGMWNDDLIKAAISYLPQSTVGDLVNRAIIAIYNDSADCMEPLELDCQVHDSIDGQYDDPQTDEQYINFAKAIIRCREHMNPVMQYGGREFIIETDLKIGYNWGHMVEVPIYTNLDDMVKSLRKGINELKGIK